MERQQHIEKLTAMLLQLDGTIDREEAEDLAKSSIYYARNLAQKYKVVAPPLWHNTLINFGLKERGLCYEWANDLLVYLSQKKYRTLMFHRIGANVGRYFEHNALSVSAKDSDVHQSIVLDAWRHSGNLYFIEFKKDEKYSWQERNDLN
ncbi:hypothetical protein KKC13_11675 [bacterium]|nr:hypothetical protein [bacterium]MBU1957538.1 hypothetical protein [bacterium]